MTPICFCTLALKFVILSVFLNKTIRDKPRLTHKNLSVLFLWSIEGDERAFVHIGRHILANLSAIREVSIPSDLISFFKKTFRAEDLIKLSRGTVAAGDDKDGVGVFL